MVMEDQSNILIVDDNISLCRTICMVLERKGCAVSTANSGREAIEKMQESPFDPIFMDVKMPHMDGVETYRRIREIRPGAMVMMMTAYAVEDLVQEALQEGAYGIVYKPVDIKTLVAIIEEARQGADEQG